MHLTFLTPWPALAAAALTVPALLLLYFLKLRRRPVRVSSTLLWEQATRDLQVNVPFRLIRPTWLLFLQLLILAFFLLALARPALNMAGGTPEKVLLIIDRSASMNALDGAPTPASPQPHSRLDEAKDRARRTIDELSRTSSGSSFAVIELAAASRIAAPFSHDRAAALEAITAIQPSDQTADLAAALRLAGPLLADEASESSRARPGLVYLFSDGSFPAPAEGYSLAGADFRFAAVGQASRPPALDAAAPQPPSGHDNLGIVALAARRDWDDPSVVRLFARVRNASAGAVATPLVLSIDGQEIERKPLDVPGTSAATPNQEPEATATFQITRREGGTATLTIAREDLLASDNSASVILDPASKPRILVVIPDPPTAPAEITPGQPAPPRGQEWIITDILAELKLPTRTMPASAFNREMAGDAPPQADLVIFDRVSPGRAPRAPSISFGAGLPSEGLSFKPGPANPSGTYVLTWERSHPTLRSVALDSVYISHPGTLTTIPRPDTPAPRPTELARGSAGPLIELLEDRATRRLLTTFDLAHSNWPLTPAFPIFLAQAIDYLTLRADGHAGRFFTTAQPVEIETAPATRRVFLSGPQRLERPLDAGAPTPAGLARHSLGVFDRAGVYRMDGAPPATDPNSPTAVVAVNLLDPLESSLAVADQLRVGGESITGAGASQEPLELWPHLIAAALVLLTIEWFLNAFLMKV